MNLFTFYLASIFDYLHYRYPELLHTCLTDGLGINPAPTEFISGEEVAALTRDPNVKDSIADQPREVVLRDVTLTDREQTLRVDLLLVGKDQGLISCIAIETGFSFDSSTRSDGIERVLQSAFQDDLRIVPIHLSATGRHDLIDSHVAAQESHRGGPVHPSLIFWSGLRAVIEGLLPHIGDDYFARLFQSVCHRIEREVRKVSPSRFSRPLTIGNGRSTRELLILIDKISKSGGNVAMVEKTRYPSLVIALTQEVLPFAEQIGNWLARTVERGKSSRLLQPVPFEHKTSNEIEPGLLRAHMGSALSDLWDVSATVGQRLDLPGLVRNALQVLQSSIRYALGGDPGAVLIEEFLASCSCPTVADFYRRLICIANMKSNPYLRISVDTRDSRGSLGIDVLPSTVGKSGVIPIVTLECRQIVVTAID